eukprot:TRINITY_DN34099_c0_g1_i1.p1 TRINITY_DN34099_c0_g1~~TRINITY_DN34099_c0_g1_i1.p1  ORF type:complete len:152 (+),score=27.29 TRINITY_DN34099_c0_g1_i1:90-545(+)
MRKVTASRPAASVKPLPKPSRTCDSRFRKAGEHQNIEVCAIAGKKGVLSLKEYRLFRTLPRHSSAATFNRGFGKGAGANESCDDAARKRWLLTAAMITSGQFLSSASLNEPLTTTDGGKTVARLLADWTTGKSSAGSRAATEKPAEPPARG